MKHFKVHLKIVCLTKRQRSGNLASGSAYQVAPIYLLYSFYRQKNELERLFVLIVRHNDNIMINILNPILLFIVHNSLSLKFL